jgi:hypothetical protein
MALAKRTRWTGDIQQLIDALDLHGPGDIKYTEKANEKVDHKALTKNTLRLQNLAALSGSLNFKRSDIEKALKKVSAEHPEWHLTDEMNKDFQVTVSKRLMAMCRHVSQALRRASQPKWVLDMDLAGRSEQTEDEAEGDLGDEGNANEGKDEDEAEDDSADEADEECEEDGDEEQEEEEPAGSGDDEVEAEDEEEDKIKEQKAVPVEVMKRPAAAHAAAVKKLVAAMGPVTATSSNATFIFGYSPEQETAWRALSSKPEAKLYTKDIVIDSTGGDLAPAIATWEDGIQYKIPELTNLALKTRLASMGGIKQHFNGKTKSGAPVVVKDRSEGPYRPSLVSLYLSGKHACNVKVEEPITQEQAVKIMVEIATKLTKGECEKADLYKERNQMMEQMGMPKPGTRKKPSAAKHASEDDDADEPQVRKRPARADTEEDADETQVRKRPARAVKQEDEFDEEADEKGDDVEEAGEKGESDCDAPEEAPESFTIASPLADSPTCPDPEESLWEHLPF